MCWGISPLLASVKANPSSLTDLGSRHVVPKVGFEPTWALGPLRPERSASPCSATSALLS